MPALDADEAAFLARIVAGIRLLLGVAALLAPRLAARALFRGPPPPSTVALLRMFGGREVALGAGALLAARQGPARLRGWVEAGAVADGVDALVLAGDRRAGMRALPRSAALLGAVGATLSAPVLASALSRRPPPAETALQSGSEGLST